MCVVFTRVVGQWRGEHIMSSLMYITLPSISQLTSATFAGTIYVYMWGCGNDSLYSWVGVATNLVHM